MNGFSFKKLAKIAEKNLEIARAYGKQIRKEDEGMKTKEMIESIEKDPRKEFISKVNKDIKAKGNPFTDDIELYNHKTKTKIVKLGVKVLNGEWEEVKKPIGFVELLEKISKEGDITVDFKDYKNEHNFKDVRLDQVLLHLAKEFTGDCLAETLLESKWYIKD